MSPTLVFDLETIPDVNGLRVLHGWDPSTCTDQEVVERAQAKQKDEKGSDFLPLHLQKIVAISCVFRDDQGFRVKTLGVADDSEKTLMTLFFKTIERYVPTLVSWNGSGFDLPVLHYRSLIAGVPAPRYWDMGEWDRDFKFNNYINRYHTRHTDLMDILAKYNGRANAPLDEIAKLCGFPGKMGMDGSQVWSAWTSGQQELVRAYCETDVVNTWLVFCRFRWIKGAMTSEEYIAELALVRESLCTLNQPHWEAYLAQWSDTHGV